MLATTLKYAKPVVVALLVVVTFALAYHNTPTLTAPSDYPPLDPKLTEAVISGDLHVDVFRANWDLILRSAGQAFFGDIFRKIQTREGGPYDRIYTLLCLSVILALLFCVMPGRLTATLCFASSFFLSILTSIRLSLGWDEFYINLRHSFVLATKGFYSLNVHSMVEGSVDFLPLAITGLLGMLGLPLEESLICITLLGNAIVMLAALLIVSRLTQSRNIGMFAALGAAFFPAVVYVGATGFTATIFSGVLLLAFYFFYLTERKYVGLLLLSILPLIRIEGILAGFLLWVLDYGFMLLRKPKQGFWGALQSGLIVAGPFLLLSCFRWYTFGSPIPTPVIFKNANLAPDFLMVGLGQLKDSIVLYALDHLMYIAIVPFMLVAMLYRKSLRIVAPTVILFVFVLTYFSGGGDWLPLIWNRYMMPFTLWAYLISLSVIVIALAQMHLVARVFALLLLSGYIWSYSSFMDPNIAFRTMLKNIDSYANRWSRVDMLCRFGSLLKQTTPKDIVIGSPEVATIMYCAERDVLDLLGVANSEIASSRLNPRLPGDIAHRRRAPETIAKHRPQILVLYEMYTDGVSDFRERLPQGLADSVRVNFHQAKVDIAYYRAGSFRYLNSLGYKYVTVSGIGFTFNYMVHKSIFEEHVRMLRVLNIEYIGEASLPYRVSPQFTTAFPEGGFDGKGVLR